MTTPTAAQLREYIEAADLELGPACCDAWVEWCRQALVDAWVAQAGRPLPDAEPKPRSDPPGVLFGPWMVPRDGPHVVVGYGGGGGGRGGTSGSVRACGGFDEGGKHFHFAPGGGVRQEPLCTFAGSGDGNAERIRADWDAFAAATGAKPFEDVTVPLRAAAESMGGRGDFWPRASQLASALGAPATNENGRRSARPSIVARLLGLFQRSRIR